MSILFTSVILEYIVFILTHLCIATLVNNMTNVYKHHKVHRIHYEFKELSKSICFAYNWPKVHINLAWFPHRTKFPQRTHGFMKPQQPKCSAQKISHIGVVGFIKLAHIDMRY